MPSESDRRPDSLRRAARTYTGLEIPSLMDLKSLDVFWTFECLSLMSSGLT
jgi:hypothetical protein